MDIYERYEEALAELEAFLKEDKYGQEIGQWYKRLADILFKLVKIEAEAVGLMLERLKETDNVV